VLSHPWQRESGRQAGVVPGDRGLKRCSSGHKTGMSEDAGAPQENPEKDRSDWVTGGEPMTGPQRSYLSTLAQEAGQEVPDDLTKAQASELIDRLQQQTGRGKS
jgi:hypothetical protein